MIRHAANGRVFIPYEVGAVVGNVEILAVGRGDETRVKRYRVRHLCCGWETDMPHRTIFMRIRNKSTMCRHCSAKAKGYKKRAAAFPVGYVISGVTIVKNLGAFTTSNGTLYRIRHHCCGVESVTSHTNLKIREKRKIVMCVTCAALARGERERNERDERDRQWRKKNLTWPARTNCCDGKSSDCEHG